MAIDPDPYRTLGLARGASIDEIKRAYRRLAKIHHPDAAGEKNVPRFLAIQAAYEQLAGGADGRGPARGPAAPRKAWEADPERGDATRRAYGGRARWSPPGSTGAGGPSSGAAAGGAASAGGASAGGPASAGGASAGGASSGGSGSRSKAGARPRPGPTRSGRRATSGSGPGTAGGTREGTGAGGATAGSGTDAGAAGTPPRGPGSRKRNKATLGSTSYDGVEGPFEPDWRGASWYGTTSGTYWTLNPKEYADPRKHGPEYQARARRSTRPGQAAPASDTAERSESSAPEAQPSAAPDADPQPAAGPTHTTSSWWESTTGATGPEPGPSAGAEPSGPAAGPAFARPADAARSTTAPPPPDIGRALGDIGRALIDPTFGGGRGRIGRAFIGWLPIAFGVSWLVGEITGCGRFAATCTGLADPIVLALQVGALLALLVLPVVASIAAMGAVTLLGAAVAAAFVLSATGDAADGDSRRVALGAVLLVSWLAGIVIAVARRVRVPASTTRPVS
jgi:hypothetical protein